MNRSLRRSGSIGPTKDMPGWLRDWLKEVRDFIDSLDWRRKESLFQLGRSLRVVGKPHKAYEVLFFNRKTVRSTKFKRHYKQKRRK